VGPDCAELSNDLHEIIKSLKPDHSPMLDTRLRPDVMNRGDLGKIFLKLITTKPPHVGSYG
jgi:hypothetical protein